jgi:hypothetical protein
MEIFLKCLRQNWRIKVAGITIFAICTLVGLVGVLNPSEIAFLGVKAVLPDFVIASIWGFVWFGLGLVAIIEWFFDPLVRSIWKNIKKPPINYKNYD